MQKLRALKLNPVATHVCAFILGCILLKIISASSSKVQTALRQNVLFQIDGIITLGEGNSFFLGTTQNCVLSDAPVRIIQNSDHPVYMVSLPRSYEILKLLQEHAIATLRWIPKKDGPFTLCYETPKVIYGSF